MKRNFIQSKIVNTFVLLLLALFFSGVTIAQTTITIGSGSSTNAYLPTYSYYNYSLTQQIYTAAEIGRAGTITSIAFKVSNSKSTTRSIDVYMSHTTNTNFSSNNAWVSQSTSYRVFSGSVTFSASGWTTITLATPFEYDGTSNLLLTIDDNTGSYVSSSNNSPQFYVYSASSNTAIYKYNDNTNYNPASMTTAGTRFGSKNQVQFVIETCGRPTNLAVPSVTGSTATLNWTGSAGSYNVRYATMDDVTEIFSENFESGLGSWTIRTQGDNAAQWRKSDPSSGLSKTAHSGSYVAAAFSWNSTAYNADNWLITPQLTLGGVIKFWVNTNGSYPDDFEVKLSTSGNAVANFTTTLRPMGPAPSDDWTEISIDISAYEGRTGYIAIHHVYYDGNYLLIDDFSMSGYNWTNTTATGTNIILSGLSSQTEYVAQVQANCGGGDLSGWTGTSFFTECDAISVFPYSEGFERGIPACWKTIDRDGDGHNWRVAVASNGSPSTHSGNAVAISESYNNNDGVLTSDNWLITQAINIPAEGEYIAEWYAANQDPDFPDTYSVYISTVNTVESLILTTPVISSHTPGTEYEKQSISLADYAGQTIYIAFRHNDTDKFYIKLDDFSVYVAPTGVYEIELTSLAPNNNTRVVAGESFDIEGVVTNNGARINSYVVSYMIDGGTPVIQNITDIDLANGATHNFTLAGISLTAGRHTIVVTISEPNGEDDGYPLDNTKTISLTVITCSAVASLPYTEHFDNDINPCWTLIDNDSDGTDWYFHQGYAVSFSGGISVDNWIISPAFTIPSTGYIVQWKAKNFTSSYYGEYATNSYDVYIATSNTISAFTSAGIKLTHTPGDTDDARSISLDEYIGQTIYIAFRNNVTNKYIIGIDDFKVFNACDISINTMPYEQDFSLNPLPGCWLDISNNTANKDELGVDDNKFSFSSYYEATDYNQYLLTPVINLPDDLPIGLPIVLEFKYAASYSEEETFRVMTSTSAQNVSSLSVHGSNLATSSTSYTDYYGEIPANSKYIALNYFSNYKYQLYIDDLKISLKPEIALESVTPADNSYVFVGDDFTISGVIKNMSTTLSAYKVSYTVDGGTPIDYKLSGLSIPYKETHSFSHPTPISLTAGEHTIVVTISDPDGKTDFDVSNNSTTIHVTAYACTPHSDDDQSAIDASDHKVRVWTGLAGSSDWNTAGNWLQYNGTKYSVAGTLSNNTTNVFIVALDNCVTASVSNTANIADGNTATVKDINIGTGKTLSMGSGTLNVAGDFTNNGTFTAEAGTVVFNGSEAQTISSASALAFNNITFNNSNGINLGVAPAVNGTATFTSGIVSGNVTFGAGGSSAGANLSSYVNGTVTKTGNGSSFTFPTGSDGVLGTITATIGSGSWVSAKYNHNSADNGDGTHGFTTDVIPRWWNAADMCGNADERFDHVSNFEYWDVSSPVELSNVTLVSEATSATEHFNSTSAYVNNDIQLAAYTNGCWKNFEGTAVISGADHNVITITGATIPKDPHRAAADFLITLGSKSKNTVLPIELTSFTATCDGRSALVEWSTASERNNDYFSLERSDDAINFTEIARVAGAGNSIEQIDYSYTDYGIHGGDNYYRLVQVDYDGTRTVSDIVVANCVDAVAEDPEVMAYPNPFSGELTLVLDNFDNRAATIEVYDMLGKLIYTEKASAPQNSYETILNLSNLPSGAYTVRVSTNDFVINKNVVKN